MSSDGVARVVVVATFHSAMDQHGGQTVQPEHVFVAVGVQGGST